MANAFIVQPTKDLSNSEIDAVRKSATAYLKSIGYTVVSNDFGTTVPSSYNVPDAYFLGKAIDAMAKCECVYFTCRWYSSRACRIMHQVAVAYNLCRLYDPNICPPCTVPAYTEDKHNLETRGMYAATHGTTSCKPTRAALEGTA